MLLIVTFGGGADHRCARAVGLAPRRREDWAGREPEVPGCAVARPGLCVERTGRLEAPEGGADLPKRSLSVRGSALVSPDPCETDQSGSGPDSPGLPPRPSAAAAAGGAAAPPAPIWTRRASDPLWSARPARLGVTTGHRLPRPASDAHLRATPARQALSDSASRCLPLPAAAAPIQGLKGNPRGWTALLARPSQRALPLHLLHPSAPAPSCYLHTTTQNCGFGVIMSVWAQKW